MRYLLLEGPSNLMYNVYMSDPNGKCNTMHVYPHSMVQSQQVRYQLYIMYLHQPLLKYVPNFIFYLTFEHRTFLTLVRHISTLGSSFTLYISWKTHIDLCIKKLCLVENRVSKVVTVRSNNKITTFLYKK